MKHFSLLRNVIRSRLFVGLHIICIVILSNGLQLHAQATQASNNWNATRYIGWGATSGDLNFKTNNTTRMTLQNTTGFFGIGTTTPSSLFSVGATSRFQVDASGNIASIRGVSYSFPAVIGVPGTVLTHDGGGTLNWRALSMPPGTAPGQISFWNGTSWVLLSPGTHGQTLTLCNGTPRWGPCVPTITTIAATSGCSYDTGNSGYSGGNISFDGGSPILARGVCWSTTSPVDTSDSKTYNGTGSGVFTSTMPGVTVTTKYYVRAYAINSAGISYGNEVTVTIPIAIGYVYQGGVIAYLFSDGIHGLIAEPLNPSTRCSKLAIWGCKDIPTGATGTAIGTGQANTTKILAANCPEAETAAKYCNDLSVGGFNDWYLPSKDELNAIMANAIAIGSVHPHCSSYWSSSENSSINVWYQVYLTGGQGVMLKFDPGDWIINGMYSFQYVRAIRTF